MTRSLLLLFASPVALLAAARSRTAKSGAWDSEEMALILAVLMIAAILTWVVSRRRRLQRGTRQNNPGQLFRELCRAFALRYAERRLLAEIAAWHQLPQPALVFLDPQRFEDPAMINQLGKPNEIAELARRLFSASGPADHQG